MARAIVALLAFALAFPLLIIAAGMHETLGNPLHVGMLLFAMVLAMGFPALATFCKKKWWGLGAVAMGGTLGGALCALPFVGGAAVHTGFLVVAFALAGLCLSVPFWFAAVWRNETLTCPKEFCLPCGAVYKFARNVLRRPLRG